MSLGDGRVPLWSFGLMSVYAGAGCHLDSGLLARFSWIHRIWRGGFVGWVLLAPFEFFNPWWRVGRGYYFGRCGFYGDRLFAGGFFFNQRFHNSLTVFRHDAFVGGFRDRGFSGCVLLA